jgi:hypothetical protein
MNLNNIKEIFGISPQKKAQDKYKETAKARGLMSYAQFESLLQSRDFATLSEVMSNSKLKLSIPCSVNFEVVNSTSHILELKDKVIFDNKNFHYIHFANEELLKTVALLQGQEVDLNVNHSQNPEHYIGSFTNARLNDQDQIVANISIDLDNPSFDAQKYAIKQGGQLGFSIEVEFDWDWDFIIQPINANITGLATTMIPSAPATLTDIDNSELLSGSTDPTDTKSVKQNNLSMDTTNTPIIVDEVKTEGVIVEESQVEKTQETETVKTEEATNQESEVQTQDNPVTATPEVKEETLSIPKTVNDSQYSKLEANLAETNKNFDSAINMLTNIITNLSKSQEKTNKSITDLSASIKKLNEPTNLNNYIS